MDSIIREIKNGKQFWVVCIEDCAVVSLLGNFIFYKGQRYKVKRISENTSTLGRNRFVVNSSLISKNFRFAGFVQKVIENV